MQLLTPTQFPTTNSSTAEILKSLRGLENTHHQAEPQAVWDAAMSEDEWEMHGACPVCCKIEQQWTWKKLKNMPDRWQIGYP
jgi:hypothetical protein